MEDYYSEWRRRLAVHAALLLLFSILVGYVYHNVLQTDDAPHCTAENIPHEPNDPLTPYDPDFEAAMEDARDFMRAHPNAMKKLAE